MRKSKGGAMIKTICQIDLRNIEYISYECDRCGGVSQFRHLDSSLRGCPLCGKPFDDDERLAIKDLANAMHAFDVIKNREKKIPNISFVSIEGAAARLFEGLI